MSDQLSKLKELARTTKNDLRVEIPGDDQGAKGKERITIYLPVILSERLKNTAFWLPGASLSNLAEVAIGKLMDDLEKERGEPFPERHGKLRTGKPPA